ncbi:MAG: TyeA family type III secretion system gatekeeper subunit [Gammaproteobacteria bacterium]
MAIQGNLTQPRANIGSASVALKSEARETRTRDATKAPVVVSDPTAMMADMAEELGFIIAENSGGSDDIEDDKDAAFDDLIDELIRKSIKQAQKAERPEEKDQLSRLREQVVQEGLRGRPDRALDDLLRQYTAGSAQRGLAMLSALVEMASSDPELQRLGFDQTTLEDYAIAREARLNAALNLSEVLSDDDRALPDTAERMLSTYENSIASSQSVLQTFQRLGQAEGIDSVTDWSAFLTEAVAADLSKQTSSTEKAQLQLILMELKGFRTFNTLAQGLERISKIMPAGKAPLPAHLLQSTLNFIEQPLREMPGFEDMSRGLELQDQILFFQGFRNLLKSIPDDAYASPEQKAGTLVPLQKRVDDLTWSEEV